MSKPINLSMAALSLFEQQQQQNPFLLPNSTSNDQFSGANSLDHLMSHITNKNSSSIDHSSSTVTHMDKKRKCKQPNNSAQSKDMREVLKGKKQKKMTKEGEEKMKLKQEKKAVAAQLGPTGYIHVRARRGQATDNHSLAERVRRERISERMKLLQALVPGCDKVSGKALMLDEVINYVQSLQNQVEFLSMKLASVNPMFYDFGTDLESFMVSPDQDLSNLPSPMASMQECSPTNISSNNCHLLQENSATNFIMFPNVLSQHFQASTRQALWEMDDHRQNIMNQSAFNNSLFSFR